MMPSPRNRRAEGAEHEHRAQRALEAAGLRCRERNAQFRVGEIDLVMDDGDTLVFVEVRQREAGALIDAVASVGPRKQQRWLRAALAWLAANPAQARRPCRFDLVAIDGDALRWERNVLQADGFRP